MLAECLLVAAFQVGPFYEQKPDYRAVRPFYSNEGEVTDILWPAFTVHRDWWRLLWFVEGHRGSEGDRQFSIYPFWWSGTDGETGDYRALWPLYGRHPHFLLVHDFEFALWPLWMRYRMPRPSTGEWLTSNAVLFPLFSWRSDGSWGVWPLAGVNHQRESDHRYALWPFVTWAGYRADRDTAGAGGSWMVWPFYGQVRRERERQTLVLPPFFSWCETASGRRLRCPWPFFEWERGVSRERISVFPFYERTVNLQYGDGSVRGTVTRFGWKLVELYDHETRVFPFYVRHRGDRDEYLRVWPFWETKTHDGVAVSRAPALLPLRHASAVDRNWAKFWTFYESESNPVYTDHSLLWGIVRWRTWKD